MNYTAKVTEQRERSARRNDDGRWRRALKALGGLVPALPTGTIIVISAAKYCLYAASLEALRRPTGSLAAAIIAGNLLLYLLIYGVLFLSFYRIKGVKEALAHLKFNPKSPDRSMVLKETRRTLCTGFIGSLYEIALVVSFASGALPLQTRGAAGLPLILGFLLIAMWADTHFYFTHRLLHSRALFRRVHAIHHESFNPAPWSGLSFHPAEAALYFSSLLIAYVIPLHLAHIVFLKVILDVTPAFGHLGYGGWTGGSHFHYIHHAKGRSNFGATVLWDALCGTREAARRAR